MTQTSRGLAAAFRKDAREVAGTNSKYKRYPESMQKLAVRFFESASPPVSVDHAAKQLGVSFTSMRDWLKKHGENDPALLYVPEPQAEPIRCKLPEKINATDPFEDETVTLIAPQGFRLEGLSPRTAVAMLRELQA